MVLSNRHQRRTAAAPDADAAAPLTTATDPPQPPWPDELTLSRLCASAVSHCCDAGGVGGECLRESLLAELADAPAHDCEALATRVADVAASLDLDEELVPPAELAAALWRELAAWRDAELAAAGEDLPPGCCELCERRMPLTRHHLIPRSQHAALRARGVTQAHLARTLACCRQCHNAVHAAADEATLGASYDSREALLSHPAIARFVAWAAKQRGRADASHLLQHRR